MIRNRTIICIASRWDLEPTSKHHVMTELARFNRVLWVNYHGMRRPRATLADARSAASAVARIVKGSRRINESMMQLTPAVLPGGGSGIGRAIHRRAVVAQIRRALRKIQSPSPNPVQLWSFAPDVAFLGGAFNEERFVYYCVDEFAEFDGADVEELRASERELLDRADIVLASSQALYDSKSKLHDEVHLVRHGVDVEHFARAMEAGMERPAELASMRGPIIGFFGLVHHWVDVELIAETARRMPGAQFVLIGQVLADVSALRSLSNVHLLGRRRYSELPAYCAAFDAAIVPFHCTELTRNVNPIKLREYLAAGLPVVSTPLPEARVYEPEVVTASGGEAFAIACAEAVDRSSPQERRRRSACVADQTWSSVVERVSSLVMGVRRGALVSAEQRAYSGRLIQA